MRRIFLHAANYLVKEKAFFFSAFFEKIGEISDEFNDKFADFDFLKENVKLFNNPIEVDVESQPLYLQQELYELQSDPFLLSRKNECYKKFWKLTSKEQLPYLRDFAQKMCCMFDSTYICENGLSIIKQIKSNTRNRRPKLKRTLT